MGIVEFIYVLELENEKFGIVIIRSIFIDIYCVFGIFVSILRVVFYGLVNYSL